jgi:hypothetical protein
MRVDHVGRPRGQTGNLNGNEAFVCRRGRGSFRATAIAPFGTFA